LLGSTDFKQPLNPISDAIAVKLNTTIPVFPFFTTYFLGLTNQAFIHNSILNAIYLQAICLQVA
jgi:hypothetical protein